MEIPQTPDVTNSTLNPHAPDFVPQLNDNRGQQSDDINFIFNTDFNFSEQDQEILNQMINDLLLDNALDEICRELEVLLDAQPTETLPPSYDELYPPEE